MMLHTTRTLEGQLDAPDAEVAKRARVTIEQASVAYGAMEQGQQASDAAALKDIAAALVAEVPPNEPSSSSSGNPDTEAAAPSGGGAEATATEDLSRVFGRGDILF